MTDSFPRQQARTRRFSLGVPHSFRVSSDGSRVAFLRSRSGTDPVTCLWQVHVSTGQEELVADPAALEASDADLPAQEKARRERAREQAGGIVSYATDSEMSVAAFGLGGRVYVAGLAGLAGPAREIGARAPALDPRPDPSGSRIGYVCAGALHVIEPGTGEDTVLADPGSGHSAQFGLAEFVAAEEMGRMRGYWWAPDGSAILTARVDEAPVHRWYIADPANPARPATEVAYPAAGTPNADVALLLLRLDGSGVEVGWDRAAFPYLVTVSWDAGDPLIVVQTRDQLRMRLLRADPATGMTTLVREETDQHWVDIVPGVPALAGDGKIVWTTDDGGARRLLVASQEEHAAGTATPVTPATLNVREVLSVDGDAVLFTAYAAEPAEIGLWLYRPAGLQEVSAPGGVHSGTRAGGTTVVASRTLAEPGPAIRVLTGSPGDMDLAERARIASLAARPSLPAPHPDMFAAGGRAIRTALLLPSWHQPGSGRLPVLLDPYGGPHAQRVLAAGGAFLTSQWFAEQGFAVLVADGRGTPGRGPGWERTIWRDPAGPVLEDQVAALHAAAERNPDLDTGRVGIRGWSFGGFLAALAVLRRPDVFHAAVAGAPPTDWRLYDTHYTERYLGHPEEDPAAYDNCSLPLQAHLLSRPLLLIHGLADDNVVVAHTLRLSSALLAAGRPHSVLPLSGVTHMTPQEDVAENLLLLQVEFLRQALGMTPHPDADNGQRGM
ncbi:MAG TPA: prolyl oligopeptidase family serine peptidase [Streptosporangiaceae bacterium]|nr:prolyl oligopeptidase family serine peptidase [Streptosporangiaceae bacterium]